MTKDQSVFFELLRAGLWESENREIRIDGTPDWDEVYRLAEEQSVLGLVAAGLDKLPPASRPPQEVLLQFIGAAMQIEQQNKAMNEFLSTLIDKLSNKDVYTLLVKGQGIAQCYEKPLWRSCGDIDLFLSEGNFAIAQKMLLPIASSIEDEYAYTKHLGMTIDDWVVELHGSLRLGLSSRMDKVLDDIQKDTFYQGNVRSWLNGRSQVFMLTPENDAAYVFTHFLNHFYKEGLGIRQICDWCRLLWTYKDSLNHGLLESRIKKAGLMTEWRAFGAFAVEYLGMPVEAMPFYSADRKWKRKADKICAFVMEVGNFGHNRDMSHFAKYPFVVRKCISMGRRIGDIINHAKIFPMSSLRFFPRIMYNGMVSAIKGEG